MDLAPALGAGSISKREPQGEYPNSVTRKIHIRQIANLTGYSNIVNANSGLVSDVTQLSVLIGSANPQLTAYQALWDYAKIKNITHTIRFLPEAGNWTASVDGSQFTDPRFHGIIAGIDSDGGFSGDHNIETMLDKSTTKLVDGFVASISYVPTAAIANAPLSQGQWYNIADIGNVTFFGGWFAHLLYVAGTSAANQRALLITEIDIELAGAR